MAPNKLVTIYGNVNLELGQIYRVIIPGDEYWPELKTVLKYCGEFMNIYSFEIIDENHLKKFQEANLYIYRKDISYPKHTLYTAKFEHSTALQILYGSK